MVELAYLIHNVYPSSISHVWMRSVSTSVHIQYIEQQQMQPAITLRADSAKIDLANDFSFRVTGAAHPCRHASNS